MLTLQQSKTHEKNWFANYRDVQAVNYSNFHFFFFLVQKEVQNINKTNTIFCIWKQNFGHKQNQEDSSWQYPSTFQL